MKKQSVFKMTCVVHRVARHAAVPTDPSGAQAWEIVMGGAGQSKVQDKGKMFKVKAAAS